MRFFLDNPLTMLKRGFHNNTLNPIDPHYNLPFELFTDTSHIGGASNHSTALIRPYRQLDNLTRHMHNRNKLPLVNIPLQSQHSRMYYIFLYISSSSHLQTTTYRNRCNIIKPPHSASRLLCPPKLTGITIITTSLCTPSYPITWQIARRKPFCF